MSNYLKYILKKSHPVPSIVWGLFIFILCFLPGSTFPELSWAEAFAPDKWVHVALFALWIGLYATGTDKRAKSAIILPAIGMFVFGGIIELFQEHVLISRSGEWLDWAADGAGLIMGFAVSWNLIGKEEL